MGPRGVGEKFLAAPPRNRALARFPANRAFLSRGLRSARWRAIRAVYNLDTFSARTARYRAKGRPRDRNAEPMGFSAYHAVARGEREGIFVRVSEPRAEGRAERAQRFYIPKEGVLRSRRARGGTP